MPFTSQRAKLVLTPEDRQTLEAIARSRTEPAHRVERAKMMLAFADGTTVSTIARNFRTNRPRVERCIDKALQVGPLAGLSDFTRPGRTPRLTPEARAYVVALACQKPKDLGYAAEFWTTALLAEHIRRQGPRDGHPCLDRITRGTISKILTKHQIRPHKIAYYLERRDQDFEAKMAQVLCIYRDVELWREEKQDVSDLVAVLSFDEKPGIQAIGNLAPDISPQPGKYASWGRDHEYMRHGTVTLMAGINLISGVVHGQVVDRHRSREFVAFLQHIDAQYPATAKIRMVLDNHSAHISRETRAYLATRPNRFEFIFTPKHGSWLNLVETFFSKMTRAMLRGIRVSSKQELKDRILRYLQEVNEAPVVFRWKYGLDSISVA
jgi:transposase